jgi:hypothetical protein
MRAEASRELRPPSDCCLTGLGAGAVGLEFGEMFFRPAAETVQGLDEGAAEPGDGVFDLGRNDGMNGALDEAVALEAAQGLGEHFLGDTADLALELGVTFGAVSENLDDERGPFVGDAIEDEARRALGIEDGAVGG